MEPGAYSAEFVTLLNELGEAVDLEFKEAGGGIPQSIWETICAFANTSGGTIVLGVQERHDGLVVVGVPHLQQRLDDLHSQARNQRKISRDVLTSGDVTVRTIDGKDLIIVSVRPVDRRSRPIYVNGQLGAGTYVRRHSGDHVASEHEIRQMMREASDLPADHVILPWADVTMLDREAIAIYRRRLSVRMPGIPWDEYSEIELLTTIEGYRKDIQTGEEGVTVAGLLMFGRAEHIRAWRKRHLIDARSLPRGADVSEPDWDDRVTWEGHLFGAYERLQRWLTNELPAPFKLDSRGVRIEELSGQIALREALVNMLVHADYSEFDASLILRWDGGVRFRNPGRSRVLQPAAAGSHRSDPRNTSLIRMFRLIGWAEEAGTGIPRMIRDWQALGFEPPEIDPGDDRYEFTITLSSRHLLSTEDRTWLDSLGEPCTETEQLALVIALRAGEVDNQAVRSVTGSHSADVSRALTGLRDRGLLHMVGSKRGARYILDPHRFENPAVGTVDSTERSVESTVSSVDSTERSVDFRRETGDSQNRDEHREPDGDVHSRLRQIASHVSASQYARREDLTLTIVHLCRIEALRIADLAALLNRTPHHVGQLVRDLVTDGALVPENPGKRNHQRFKASRD